MPFLDIRADHRQSQTLSPRLQQAVRLLQMSSLDFAAMVRDSLGKNPFLIAEDGDQSTDGEDSDGDPGHDLPQQADDGAADSSEFGDDGREDGLDDVRQLQPADGNAQDTHDGDHDGDQDGSSDRDLWQADTGSGDRRSEDGETSVLDSMAVEPGLNTHLHDQLNLLPLPHRDLALARAIVESLDDDGYLRTELDDLLGVAGVDPRATLQEMQIALKRVQSLDPTGVAARSVAECLLLQMPSIACPQQRAMAQTIVGDHMNTLAARDVPALARKLGASAACVEAVCDRIRHLDPRPGWRFSSSHVAYVVPDVVVKKLRGQWTVQLNPAVVPKVRLNEVYAQLFQRHRTAVNVEMGLQLNEARWTLRNVEQRFSTILDVAEAIVQRQKNFLDYGAMAMKPLGLREIADAVGIHESTVSRVTNNKYMATPVGVFELKHFFSRAMPTANGSTCSGTAIREVIKDIIDAEASAQPLSDADITRQLSQQGLVVARRTVTKYRQMLKIEAVDRRRRHAPV